MSYGPDRLKADLEALEYEEVELETASDGNVYVVIRGFEVFSGRFAGRIIDLGIPAMPNFPLTVGASIHVRANPQLFEYENVPGVRNIINSSLGSEWRYWSKNFGWTGEGTTHRLVNQIHKIFNDA